MNWKTFTKTSLVVALSLLAQMQAIHSVFAQEARPVKPRFGGAITREEREFTIVPDKVVDEATKELFTSLEKTLSNSRLIGLFTVDGKPMKDLNEETYEIRQFKKLDEDKMWLIAARIKYAKYDVTVPLVLAIEWAGKTPVITMDEITIPGMGTFSARVLFHDGKYSGTWTHGNVGGHLFGRIEKVDAEKKPDTPKEEPKAEVGKE